MAIGIGSSSPRILLPNLRIISSSSSSSNAGEGERKKPPSVLISTSPSSIHIPSLRSLYRACSHSPHRFPVINDHGDDIDAGKLALAVSHSAVVVSVFSEVHGGADEGLFGRILPAPAKNGELVGFGRAVSDLGLTASIHDVMVIPSLRRMGIGRMIVQRLLRILYSKDIYDISALCSEKEQLFFGACGFGDDILGSTTMMYAREASGNLNDAEIVTQAGRKLLIAPPLRPPLLS